MTRMLIIGGSDAGISAALRMRELDAAVEITIVLADRFPNYSICGLPFFLSGEVTDWQHLAHRKAEDITSLGIQLLMNHWAESIDPMQKTVTVKAPDGATKFMGYDKLILGTGGTSVNPPIQGLDLPGVYPLRWMADSFAVQQHLTDRSPQHAVIIGAGYIGLEMADALTLRGLSVTLIQRSSSILKTIDPTLSQLVADELTKHGVEVVTDVDIDRIESIDKRLLVADSMGFQRVTDLVIVAVGVSPATQLAQTAGVSLSVNSAIQVNRSMETNLPDIYAAGDCVETYHRILGRNIYLPLGTTAHKQGRVAGENALGGHRKFQGSLGTQVVKIFEVAAARTGLRDDEAIAAGLRPLTVETDVWHHKAYYPGAHSLRIRVTGDRTSGRLLGAQIAGHYQGEVAKRIDIFATALFHDMKMDELNDLDLSYTPPLGSPWDAVQMAAQAWTKQCSEQAL
ncbi:FAD-dependent oxidoreductase [Chamaesiphon sp. VAR_69_metabat_338]|uniref:FAD-dependent oxidoreductase n=1 Tax=Chamaesiphon sp. VAR_69_metabat_338 TaxID=2964704 RepID=UPI00286E4CA2|nr:FAD-dependent oxidoreductase [Chamaesiphon sp. VAR_69_metabat_338]